MNTKLIQSVLSPDEFERWNRTMLRHLKDWSDTQKFAYTASMVGTRLVSSTIKAALGM